MIRHMPMNGITTAAEFEREAIQARAGDPGLLNQNTVFVLANRANRPSAAASSFSGDSLSRGHGARRHVAESCPPWPSGPDAIEEIYTLPGVALQVSLKQT
jgi:hypothetical protein